MAKPAIRKATDAEKDAYRATKPLYPLYGFVTHDGVQLAIEDLREWSRENPQYEVMAPKGQHFAATQTHSLLCFTLADLKDRVEAEGDLESCHDSCGD